MFSDHFVLNLTGTNLVMKIETTDIIPIIMTGGWAKMATTVIEGIAEDTITKAGEGKGAESITEDESSIILAKCVIMYLTFFIRGI